MGVSRTYTKSAARDAGAMDTDPSPVRLWESEGHSEGYRTAHEPPSEPEMSAPIALNRLEPLGVPMDKRMGWFPVVVTGIKAPPLT